MVLLVKLAYHVRAEEVHDVMDEQVVMVNVTEVKQSVAEVNVDLINFVGKDLAVPLLVIFIKVNFYNV